MQTFIQQDRRFLGHLQLSECPDAMFTACSVRRKFCCESKRSSASEQNRECHIRQSKHSVQYSRCVYSSESTVTGRGAAGGMLGRWQTVWQVDTAPSGHPQSEQSHNQVSSAFCLSWCSILSQRCSHAVHTPEAAHFSTNLSHTAQWGHGTSDLLAE